MGGSKGENISCLLQADGRINSLSKGPTSHPKITIHHYSKLQIREANREGDIPLSENSEYLDDCNV
jgi:hypothetical protein